MISRISWGRHFTITKATVCERAGSGYGPLVKWTTAIWVHNTSDSFLLACRWRLRSISQMWQTQAGEVRGVTHFTSSNSLPFAG